MLLTTNNYKLVSKKKNMSIDCVMMTSSLCQNAPQRDTTIWSESQSQCRIWYLVTIFVGDLPHCIKKKKKEL